MQSSLSLTGAAETSPSKWAVVTSILMLDTFVLGGAIALALVHAMLVTTMYRLITPEAQAEILNVLDHMLPYYFGYGIAALGITVLSSAVLGLYARSWKLALVPLALFAGLCGAVALII